MTIPTSATVQGRTIVYAVADERELAPFRLQPLHDLDLLGRQHLGVDFANTHPERRSGRLHSPAPNVYWSGGVSPPTSNWITEWAPRGIDRGSPVKRWPFK